MNYVGCKGKAEERRDKTASVISFYLNYVGCKVQDAWCYINSWTSFYLIYVGCKEFCLSFKISKTVLSFYLNYVGCKVINL